MIEKNLSTLKINKLTKEQFEQALAQNRIQSDQLYMVADESSGSGALSEEDKKKLECIIFDDDTPQLTINNGICEIDMYDDAIYITADNGLYVDGNEVVTTNQIPDYITSGAKSGTTIGSRATAEGYKTIASGNYSHAEGHGAIAMGEGSHAEGRGRADDVYRSSAYTFTRTSTQYQYTCDSRHFRLPGYIFIDENWTYVKITAVSGTESPYLYTLDKDFVTTEGETVDLYKVGGIAFGDYSHAEGLHTTASGDYSHAEGDGSLASGDFSHAEGTAGTIASGDSSHAEGYATKASGDYSHTEGMYTIASGDESHAEGCSTTASSRCSHAEGDGTTASGFASHAEGYETTASGSYSHAGGRGTIANSYQYAVGKYNADTTAPTSLIDKTAAAGIFIVGIGTSDTDRSNGFRVNPAGNVYGVGTFGTTGADYAEYFEWFDGNPNNEDRRGHFVTLDGDKIRYATANDDYILGVVSTDPSVAGDMYSEDWHNRYLKDIFGSNIVDVVEVEETTNEFGEIIPAHTERRWVLNPDYNPDLKYVSREERPEWTAIGIVGKLVVVDDGTCQVNGYCYPNINGIATASQEKTNYRVIERLDDTHIRIFIK